MEQKADKPQENKDDFNHIVRIANADLNGDKKLINALTKIKGVSFMFSNLVCSLTKMDKLTKVGYLKEDQIKKIEEVLKEPLKFKVPLWMLNRRKDPETGQDKHLFGGDLAYNKDNDIKLMKKIRCYRGIRHTEGLPVRGQRTKSNFRKNKGKVSLGVKKREGAKAGK